jgi:hypothetical protein
LHIGPAGHVGNCERPYRMDIAWGCA